MDKEKILQIYEKFGTPGNVVAHMEKVGYLCGEIADGFIEVGVEINKPVLLSAALLHDTCRASHTEAHAQVISDYLRECGEPKIASIIEKHDFFRIDDLETWEEKILYYADKRVEHNQIVPLSVRFEEGRKRNFDGAPPEKVKETEEKVYALEKEIFKIIPNNKPQAHFQTHS